MPLFHLLVSSACSICLEFPRIVWHRKTKIAVRWISFAQCHIPHTLLATNDYKAEVLKMPYPLQKYLMIACCLFVFSAGCQKPESASVGAQGETVQSQQAQLPVEKSAGRSNSEQSAEHTPPADNFTATLGEADTPIDATELVAKGLYIHQGKGVLLTPITLKAEGETIEAIGRRGHRVVVWKFQRRPIPKRLPPTPEYFANADSWSDIMRLEDGGVFKQFGTVVRYLAMHNEQDEFQRKLANEIHKWPFVAAATWVTNTEYDDKAFLRIVSKAGDSYDFYTNWGDPENLKDETWRSFTKPEVWGCPQAKDIRDGLMGRGRYVDEMRDDRMIYKSPWFEELNRNGGIYVRIKDSIPGGGSWSECRISGVKGGKPRSASDYEWTKRVLDDVESDRPTLVYDFYKPGYPSIPRDDRQHRCLKFFVETYDKSPLIQQWLTTQSAQPTAATTP